MKRDERILYNRLEGELKAREGNKKILDKLLDLCFPEQLEFIKDTSTRKAMFVSRRSGKSYTDGIYLLHEALKYPNCKFLYLSLSKDSAINILYNDILKSICDKLKIKNQWIARTCTLTLDNGSTIRLSGLDASPTEKNKLLGGRYRLVIIDEAQGITQDLEEIITAKLQPAVADYILKGGGTIALSGTPSNHRGNHYWYKITKPISQGPREPGWTVHTWNSSQNIYMKDQLAKQLADLDQKYNGQSYRETNWFRQEYLCEWVIEDTAKVYKYDPIKNNLHQDDMLIRSIRDNVNNEWSYVLGIDIGWEDACAFVVGAFSRTNPNFYLVESVKKNHIIISTVAQMIKDLRVKYKFISMVIDTGGSGKIAVEEIKKTHQLPLKPAIKTEKEAMIARMNSDFITDNIRVIESSNRDLIKEWQELIVDEKAALRGEFKEKEKFQNHLCDAALYCFRESKHYRSQAQATGDPEDDFINEVLRQKRRRQNPLREMDILSRIDEREEDERLVRLYKRSR